jgi:hypothetical protein
VATVTKIHAGSASNIAPGQTVTKHWNNATPRDAVWYVQAVPTHSGIGKEGTQVREVEVTRVWWKLTKTAPKGPIEDEIHFAIKNVGTQNVSVEIYIGIIA